MLRCSSSPILGKKPIFATAAEAIHDIHSGATLLVGGFGAAGSPHALCTALSQKKVNDFKVYTNAGSIIGYGIGLLFANHQVSRIACSHFGSNSFAEKQYLAGELEIEFTPQGSLAERMRAGGAGIPAFYTPTSAGTVLQQGGIFAKFCPETNRPLKFAEPKETRIINGKLCVLEYAIHGDFGLIKADIADRFGNCIMCATNKNFNIPAATAAKVVIVEAQKIVDYRLDPDQIHLPGVYVDRLVETPYETLIEHVRILPSEKVVEHDDNNDGDNHPEFLTLKEHNHDLLNAPVRPSTLAERLAKLSKMSSKERIQRRAAREFVPFVDHPNPTLNINLGIGIPTSVPDFVPKPILREIMIQTENGLLGVGKSPTKEQLDSSLINAGKETITAVPGASAFSSDQSFAMIRGGRLDLTILGALQISEQGDLANWIVPGKMTQGPGGALDLIAATKRVVCVMTHTDKYKQPKLRKECLLPLTRRTCVHRCITDKAVFDFDLEKRKMVLVEVAPEYLDKVENLRAITEAKYTVSSDLKEMEYSWH